MWAFITLYEGNERKNMHISLGGSVSKYRLAPLVMRVNTAFALQGVISQIVSSGEVKGLTLVHRGFAPTSDETPRDPSYRPPKLTIGPVPAFGNGCFFATARFYSRGC